jgi:hypothetical protein
MSKEGRGGDEGATAQQIEGDWEGEEGGTTVDEHLGRGAQPTVMSLGERGSWLYPELA